MRERHRETESEVPGERKGDREREVRETERKRGMG